MNARTLDARIATLLWLALGTAVGTGCIPIYSSAVEVNPTVGEKLRALGPIDTVRSEDAALVRQRLIDGPLEYDSIIDTGATRSDAMVSYSVFDPGFYAPTNVERADLQLAHKAGLLGDGELAELLADLDRQGKRGIVRRSFEFGKPCAAYSVYRVGLGSDTYKTYTDANRASAARTWLDRCYWQLREQRRMSSPGAQSRQYADITSDPGRGRRSWDTRLVMTPGTPKP